MAMLSQTIRNLKFMKNKKTDHGKETEKTFSYYACKNIISTFTNKVNKMVSTEDGRKM